VDWWEDQAPRPMCSCGERRVARGSALCMVCLDMVLARLRRKPTELPEREETVDPETEPDYGRD
jgi:hypothetical protein